MEEQIDKQGLRELLGDVELPLVVGARPDGGARRARSTSPTSRRWARRSATGWRRCRPRSTEHAGEEFNLNSPPQLRVILYEKLGLSPGQEDAEGAALHRRERAGEAARRAPDRRRAARVARARQAELDLPRGAAAAGRPARRPDPHLVQPGGRGDRAAVSSSNPNLQNIPVRTELGRQIRRAFVPATPGQVLLARRLLADRAADPRAPVGRRGAARGVRVGRTTSTRRRRRGCSDRRRTRSIRALRRAGEDGQLRPRLRDERVGARARASTSRPTRRRRSSTRTSRASRRSGSTSTARWIARRSTATRRRCSAGAATSRSCRPRTRGVRDLGRRHGAERADPGERRATCSSSR